jgi:hypothetical protein
MTESTYMREVGKLPMPSRETLLLSLLFEIQYLKLQKQETVREQISRHLKKGLSVDSLWARTDTLHHNEITNLNRQIRTVTRMYQQERSKNRLLKIIVIAGAGYGAYKGIQAATK